MSFRTLIEINHDKTHDLGKAFLDALQGYLSGGSTRCRDALEAYGVKVIAMRHHSEDFHIPDGIDGLTMSRDLSDKQVVTEPAGRSAPNLDAGEVGDLVEAFRAGVEYAAEEMDALGDEQSSSPVRLLKVAKGQDIEREHFAAAARWLRDLDPCEVSVAASRAALAKYATQGTGGQMVGTRDHDDQCCCAACLATHQPAISTDRSGT